MSPAPDTDEFTLAAKVVARSDETERVAILTLAPVDGSHFPHWEPGAHIDLRLKLGLVRQYSLCGDPADLSTYRIGVLKETQSRGGSIYLHERINVGDSLSIGWPRNTFELAKSTRYLFIAGGIGVTPILPMIKRAELTGAEWTLAYTGRSRNSMAFIPELANYCDHVTLFPKDESGRVDVESLLKVPEGTLVYACGPTSLLDAIEKHCEETLPPGTLRTERFRAPELAASAHSTSFVVECQMSGVEVEVAGDISILEALRSAGFEMASSCEEGVCGACETFVLDGKPDHRDSVLSDLDKSQNGCMMVCVSRSLTPRLILDL